MFPEKKRYKFVFNKSEYNKDYSIKDFAKKVVDKMMDNVEKHFQKIEIQDLVQQIMNKSMQDTEKNFSNMPTPYSVQQIIDNSMDIAQSYSNPISGVTNPFNCDLFNKWSDERQSNPFFPFIIETKKEPPFQYPSHEGNSKFHPKMTSEEIAKVIADALIEEVKRQLKMGKIVTIE